LGLSGVRRAATGERFLLHGPLAPADLDFLASRLLANPVIQRYALGEIAPSFPEPAVASPAVTLLPLRALDDDGLLALSRERRAALDLAEMRAIRAFFAAQGRDPTDVEFETLAQTWSEHCAHKTFRALIDVYRAGDASAPLERIDGLLNTYLRAATERIAAPWVRSAFVDNAGSIAFDDALDVAFKVETHNHPSAIEPFGGANTGVGGVIRDVLGVSARPIAATDVLCFAPDAPRGVPVPDGVLPPRRIRSGVVDGIRDYGNKIGLPTVGGAIWYDPAYAANPLVFCGCVGLAPSGRHPRQPRPGDRVIILGGRTGRDGLRGATFSSMTMDATTGTVAGASVQIGDPITEKGLIEVIVRARDAGLYHAITDCGAGGLSSAVGEMAAGAGAEVNLGRVRLKYPGLAPWEIWLSEAQERMVLAVPPIAVDALQELCDRFEVELTDIGAFTETGRLVVRLGPAAVLDLESAFLHGGRPQRRLRAIVPSPSAEAAAVEPAALCASEPAEILLALLAHPNVASRAAVVRTYDHEVQGGTVVKPLTGACDDGPSDACVLRPLGGRGETGLVIAHGLNPEYGKRDAYRMAHSAVDEAVRNAVAVGADPDRIALLDNFCWGDPNQPEVLGALVEAVRGCHDAALLHNAPFISGKDSLNNEYLGADGARHAIPPTLLISALGLMPDATRAVTMDLKAPGDVLYLLGGARPVLGGSHFALLAGGEFGPVPGPDPAAPALYRALHQVMRAGLVRACHDLSEGGLAVAAAEMCIGGRLGLVVTLDAGDLFEALFGEANSRLLAEVAPADAPAFEAALAGHACVALGRVTARGQFVVHAAGVERLRLDLDRLVAAWSREAW
jgi:phosphoribosylformylglycinamidine synthase